MKWWVVYLVTEEKILQAVQKQVKSCIPETEHYKYKLAEGFRTPAFLYIPTFHKEKQINPFLRGITLEMQVICFCKQDKSGNIDFRDVSETKKRLEPFLSAFLLEVEDRYLHFENEWKTVDGQPSFFLSVYYTEAVTRAEEKAEMTEEVFYRQKG